MKTEDLEVEVSGTDIYSPLQCGLYHQVRVIHKPTGLMAACSYDRTKMANAKIAYSMIEWGLAEIGWKDKP